MTMYFTSTSTFFRRATIACLLLSVACKAAPSAAPDAEATTRAPAESDASSTASEGRELPPAEQVLEQAVAATGGREALESLGSYYSESKMEIPAQNIAASIKTWWKKGNLYSETVMPGIGITRMWVNADGVWSEDPISGSRKVEGKEAHQAEWSTVLSLPAQWQRFFSSAKTSGRRQLGESTVIDVVLTSKQGDEITLSFDEKSGLLRQQRFSQETPMGAMPIIVDVEEYATYGGLKQPARSSADMGLAKAVTTIVSFEPNVEIPDTKFQPPTDKSKK